MRYGLMWVGMIIGAAVITLASTKYCWSLRERAYMDAVADVRAYHQCFISPEAEVSVRSLVHLEGGNWPSSDYMREAAHFVKEEKRDCNLVVTIDNYAAGNKP